MEQIPKKFLGISNLIFILPDDFEGNITDAVELLMDYISSQLDSVRGSQVNEESIDESMFKKLLNKSMKNKVTMRFSFYNFDEESQTYLKQDYISDNDKNKSSD